MRVRRCFNVDGTRSIGFLLVRYRPSTEWAGRAVYLWYGFDDFIIPQKAALAVPNEKGIRMFWYHYLVMIVLFGGFYGGLFLVILGTRRVVGGGEDVGTRANDRSPFSPPPLPFLFPVFVYDLI